MGPSRELTCPIYSGGSREGHGPVAQDHRAGGPGPDLHMSSLSLLCARFPHLSEKDGRGLESGEGHGIFLESKEKPSGSPIQCTRRPDSFRGLCLLKPIQGPQVGDSGAGAFSFIVSVVVSAILLIST